MVKCVSVSIAIIGPGLVGKALLQQLHEQKSKLKKLGLELKVHALLNSTKMVMFENGEMATADEWIDKLAQGEKSDLKVLESFLAKLTNPVLVDCTACQEVPNHYSSFAKRKIHVVTPNKKLGAGPLSLYEELIETCKNVGCEFKYEATVGAGLPVISTLKSLLLTGDKVKKIEGVFSGTLSYIFNNFDASKSFSQIVEVAKSSGYTEPDPRDDLSGTDVARKVVILARDCGLRVSLSDVKVESLVPAELSSSSVSDFMQNLSKFNDDIAKKAKLAQDNNSKICYTGSVDLTTGVCEASMNVFPMDHPFAQLKGSDNIIAFHTERYSAQPLFIRGPGAGADVTAAGVFSDILSIHYDVQEH